MRMTKKALVLIGLAIMAIVGLAACGSTSQPTGQQQENSNRQSNYNQLVDKQPAGSMDYSPTRETKNFWIKTWDEPGKLSYVYLMNANGEAYGYFVLVGLPVSYCTSLIPPYNIIQGDLGETTGDIVVPGPSIDGTYSSSSNCNTYYGRDALTGAYVEYTAGMGTNVLIFDQPLPQYGAAQPLGAATIDKVAG